MPYIGRSSNFGVRTRFLYTATASQTTFSGTDTQNLTLSYSDSNFIDVHQNGVLLKVVDDYTATSGTSVVLATGATASDVIEITVYDVFSIANHIKKTGDAMAGALTNIDIDGTELVLDADGDTSITADTDDRVDIKVAGSDIFHITSTSLGIGTASPNSASVSNAVTINASNASTGSILELNGAGTRYGYLFSNASNTVLSSVTSLPLIFNTGDTERGRFDSNGHLILKKNLALDTSTSEGIDFGAAGSSANTLDDYEEGTFTPTVGSGSLSSASGVYRKIGKLVHVGMKFTMPTSSSSSNNLISSLPFTVYNDNAARAGIVVSWHSADSNLVAVDFLLVENSTNGIFYLNGSALTYNTLSAKTFYLGGTYPVA